MSDSPSHILSERLTVDLTRGPDEIVVFLIGMRINTWWKPWQWLPVVRAMGRMLSELSHDPRSGLLAVKGSGPGVIVQYWDSFESLSHYASDQQGAHYPAWADFNRRLRLAGDVGIWHETFIVPSSHIECVYHHMPPTGLGSFLPRVPATGPRRTAAHRLAHPTRT